MTQDVLGEFGTTCRQQMVHRLLPILNRTLADLGELPFPPHLLVRLWTPQWRLTDDATERPIQRPKDLETQKSHYSGKKKQLLKNNR